MGTEREGVALTHLDERLFDGAGATKRDLVDYLDAVSGLILPELRGRPLSVIRVRAGQQPFMQKNLPDYAPPWIGSVTLWAESSRREVRYALCDDRRTLLWLANQRAVEYHPTLGLAAQDADHGQRPVVQHRDDQVANGVQVVHQVPLGRLRSLEQRLAEVGQRHPVPDLVSTHLVSFPPIGPGREGGRGSPPASRAGRRP